MSKQPLFVPNASRSENGKWVLGIGNFDGLHLGHQHLIQTVLDTSKASRAKAGVITFNPNPKEIVGSEGGFKRIYAYEQQLKLLLSLGLDGVYVFRFDKKFAALSPSDFVDDCLVKSMRIVKMVAGENFRFGKKREGDIGYLKKRLMHNDILLEKIPQIHMDGVGISSSLVRKCLLEGDFGRAEKLLGKKWSFIGRVVKGEGRGKNLGVPTANIRLGFSPPLKYGVYGVSFRVKGENFPGIMNFGVRPTFGVDALPLAEVHLFDFQRDIYRHKVEVTPHFFVREEKSFSSVKEIKNQIAKDITHTLEKLPHAHSY